MLQTKSKIKIKEYVCQVSSELLENSDLYIDLTDRHTDIHPTKEKIFYLVKSETSLASLAQSIK